MADRDQLIEALSERLGYDLPFRWVDDPKACAADLLDAVLPLIEADLRERLAAEIEAVPAGATFNADTRAAIASIVRGATADTDPAGDNTTERT